MRGDRRKKITSIAVVFREALKELLKNDPLRLAGATAFFTTFALPPILVILIQVFKLIIGPRTIRAELFESLSKIVGPEAVEQIVDVLRSMRRIADSWLIAVSGFIFLLFVATTLFKVIKNSLNQVWKIRPRHKHGIFKKLRTRIQSVLIILVAGILFMIGIMAEALEAIVGRYIFEIAPILSVYFNTALNYIVSLFIVTVWFSVMFRYLPDGRPVWRIALTGGLLTAFLFTIGKLLLRVLLSYSNINTVYGTSASIVLLLLFVFYSALILYFGAAFTKMWAIYKEQPIPPLAHAMAYKVVESEVDETHHTG
jgi:membrane protein